METPAPDSQALPAGTRLEEFVIERVLGSGGFGITYLARDVRLNRQVVVKENLPVQFCFRDTHSLTVAPRHTQGDNMENFRWSLENFSREAAMLASVDHPGIVKVLRSFEAFGTAYFVMPYVAGEPFDKLIDDRLGRGREFSEDELRGLLKHTLSALDHLHARGIYHRDIKPANILITKEGVPTLIDFGSARQRLSERSMTVVESAGYTPFEQLQSRGNVGPWSDLYALGATLHKALTGEPPPKATDRAFDDPLLPLADRRELAGRYSHAFLTSIDRALASRVADRWQNDGEWLAALETPSGTSRCDGDSASYGQATAGKPAGALPPGTSTGKSKPLLWAITACVVIGLGAWAVISFSHQAAPPTFIHGTQVVQRAVKVEQERQAIIAPTKAKEDEAIEVERQRLAGPSEAKGDAARQAGEQQRQGLLKPEATKPNGPATASEGRPFVNSLGMKFVPVPISSGPSKGKMVLFSMWETRRQDYEAYVAGKPQLNEAWKSPGFEQTGDHPVVCVSDEDAVAFCAWLTKSELASGTISKEDAYRLPTDAEWSIAVGIGDKEDASMTPQEKDGKLKNLHPWGTQFPPPKSAGNYDSFSSSKITADGFDWTSPVGRLDRNSYGLYDLGGNVWEWCVSTYDGSSDASAARVWRGGCWLASDRSTLLSSCRYCVSSGSRSNIGGFRCVLAVDNEPGPAISTIKSPPETKPLPIPPAEPVIHQEPSFDERAAQTEKEKLALISQAKVKEETVRADQTHEGLAAQAKAKEEATIQAHKQALEQQRLAELAAASKETPFENSLKMKFVPVVTHGTEKLVLFSIWETRRKDYAAYAEAESGVDSLWKNAEYEGQSVGYQDDHPVVCVTWKDAVAFCAWLTKRERASKKIPQNSAYRLPTDAEWSWAAGIGNKEDGTSTPREKDGKILDAYPWGTAWPPPKGAGNYNGQETKGKSGSMIGRYDDGYTTTAPVGRFAANPYGLFDMGGNVWEWCESFYDGSSGGSATRVVRGGSWSSFVRTDLRSACRGCDDLRCDDYGFRVVLVGNGG